MKNVRILTGVAIVSVVLNLFIGGYLLGQAGPRFWDPPPPRGQFVQRLGPMGPGDINIFAGMRALDPEMRAKAREAFDHHMPDLRASMDEMRGKRRVLFELLASPAADMEQIAEAFAALRRANAHVQETSHEAFLDAARTLPEDRRAALFKATAMPRHPPAEHRRRDDR